jgi:hypothetical protein
LPTAGLPITRDRRWPVITIGIDPHKLLTAVALQPSGEVTATVRRLEVISDTVGPTGSLGQLLGPTAMGVKGAAGLGRGRGPKLWPASATGRWPERWRRSVEETESPVEARPQRTTAPRSVRPPDARR